MMRGVPRRGGEKAALPPRCLWEPVELGHHDPGQAPGVLDATETLHHGQAGLLSAGPGWGSQWARDGLCLESLTNGGVL